MLSRRQLALPHLPRLLPRPQPCLRSVGSSSSSHRRRPATTTTYAAVSLSSPAATSLTSVWTPCRHYRDINKNTLADTPSGYIQDPRVYPREMKQYKQRDLSSAGEAALEAVERERELQTREELAYQGYATLATLQAKDTVLRAPQDEHGDRAALEAAVAVLEAEKAALQAQQGSTVLKAPTRERVLLLQWQQRQRRLAALDSAFSVAAAPAAGYEVQLNPDGTERLVTRAPNDPAALRPVEEEEVDPALLQPEEVRVTAADVHHVRYILALAHRRLGRYDAAEAEVRAILREDVGSVDAMECLLELYMGQGQYERIAPLLDYLKEGYEQALREGRLRPAGLYAEREQEEAKAVQKPEKAGGEDQEEEEPKAELTPVEIAISLMADMIAEEGARHCLEHGEGATSRLFANLLMPLAQQLGPTYTSLLLVALFKSVDECHFYVRAQEAAAAHQARSQPAAAASLEKRENESASKKRRMGGQMRGGGEGEGTSAAAAARGGADSAYGFIIAFLKTLVACDMAKQVTDPLRFEYFTLSKLYNVLRDSGRTAESFRIGERLLKLYRAHSSLYRDRMAAAAAAAKQPPQQDGGPTAATATTATPAATPITASPSPPDALDDVDDDYVAAYMLYVNDKARLRPKEGRELCLQAMEELPRAAGPWSTLAFLLHFEDPTGNLERALVAARHALELDPTNLQVVLQLANLYKASQRLELFALMMDRYHLLKYLLEQGASPADMEATSQEILVAEKEALEGEVGEDAALREHLARMEQALTYTMPLGAMERTFGEQPTVTITQQTAEEAGTEKPELP